MTITARVHNRTIALPPEVEVEEGAEVAVIVPERPAGQGAGFEAWLADSTGLAKGKLTTDERMLETRGED